MTAYDEYARIAYGNEYVRGGERKHKTHKKKLAYGLYYKIQKSLT
jgi:hypothetical protein